MTKPTVAECWKIISTSHPRFPLHSFIVVEPIEQEPSRFRLHLVREGQPKEPLFEGKFPEEPVPGAVSFRGEFENRKRLLVTTVSPGKKDKTVKCLCGQFYELGPGKGDGATGVWVAEEQGGPLPPEPGEEC